jgi:hypothetical protein
MYWSREERFQNTKRLPMEPLFYIGLDFLPECYMASTAILRALNPLKNDEIFGAAVCWYNL